MNLLVIDLSKAGKTVAAEKGEYGRNLYRFI